MPAEVLETLGAMGLSLPDSCKPRGNFLPYRVEGKLVFMAGQICEWNGAVTTVGPVISDGQPPPSDRAHVDVPTAQRAARVCALNLLYHLRDACGGDLGRVGGVLRVGGFVNCLPGFDQSPAVINGASDLFIALFGERGRHARTAVGVAGLPGNASAEVDAIFTLA